MRGDRRLDACRGCCPLHGAQHGALGEPATALAAGEHRIVGAGVAAQGQQRAAHGRRQQHVALHATFAQDVELHLAVFPWEHVRPGQSGELGDTQAAGVEDLEENAIALCACAAHQQSHVHLADDAFGESRTLAARLGSDPDRRAGVEGRIAEPVGIAEQGLHAQDVLAPGRLGHVLGDAAERVADVLNGGCTQASRPRVLRPKAKVPSRSRVAAEIWSTAALRWACTGAFGCLCGRDPGATTIDILPRLPRLPRRHHLRLRDPILTDWPRTPCPNWTGVVKLRPITPWPP